MKAFKAGCFALVILAVILAFSVYSILPESVPTHWNADGVADGWGASWEGAFIFPIMMAGILLLFVVIPLIVVFEKNFKGFEKEYWILAFVIQMFFFLFYIMTLLPNFGYEFNFSQILVLPMAMLFISIGILLPSFKRNFFVGIRTPWTLADDKVWKKTHQVGGKLFILAGFAALISVPFPSATIWVLVGGALIAGFGAMIYSLYLFKKSGKNKL